MRADNVGEGGILALMALLGIKKEQRPAIVALGLFGAALIYGDGAITPAISVLSALEGLNMVTPVVQPYILPAATNPFRGWLETALQLPKSFRSFGARKLVTDSWNEPIFQHSWLPAMRRAAPSISAMSPTTLVMGR